MFSERHEPLDPHPLDRQHHVHRRPHGIKTFYWLGTLWRGMLHIDTPMLYALGFLTMFIIGGLSGIFMAWSADDAHPDTYFIVAHIHYVLFGGSLFTIFAASTTGSRR